MGSHHQEGQVEKVPVLHHRALNQDKAQNEVLYSALGLNKSSSYSGASRLSAFQVPPPS